MDALSLAITELGNHMTDAGVAKQVRRLLGPRVQPAAPCLQPPAACVQPAAPCLQPASPCLQACFFLANISGNDQCKTSIVRAHGHVAIIQARLLPPPSPSPSPSPSPFTLTLTLNPNPTILTMLI